jgi:hypothetical protein
MLTARRTRWWRNRYVAAVLALAGYILAGIAPDGTINDGWLRVTSVLMFMGVYTTLGLFGLDPTAAELARPAPAHREDALSVGRLVFLGTAVAAIPIAGARTILGDVDGLLFVVSTTTLVVLVMMRIHGLSAERDALRALSCTRRRMTR